MASTLRMGVVLTLLPSDCFLSILCWLWHCKRFESIYGQIFLSSNEYIHARQRDKARRRAEIDRSEKERVETSIINGVLSFQSHLFARHLYSHA